MLLTRYDFGLELFLVAVWPGLELELGNGVFKRPNILCYPSIANLEA